MEVAGGSEVAQSCWTWLCHTPVNCPLSFQPPGCPDAAARAENLLKAQSSGFAGGSNGRRVIGPL